MSSIMPASLQLKSSRNCDDHVCATGNICMNHFAKIGFTMQLYKGLNATIQTAQVNLYNTKVQAWTCLWLNGTSGRPRVTCTSAYKTYANLSEVNENRNQHKGGPTKAIVTYPYRLQLSLISCNLGREADDGSAMPAIYTLPAS